MAVIEDVSVVRAIAGNDLLCNLYLHVNSAAICCASAALHPLPHISNLFQALMALSIVFIISCNFSSFFSMKSIFICADS